jgi:hypothetical protein
MSDRVTWEICPCCGLPAAVGWLDDSPVEFDCLAGCTLTEDQVQAFSDRRRAPVEWLTRF